MDEVHRRVLRENLTYLLDNLSPEDVLDQLFEARVISDDQHMRLGKETTPKSCVRELVVHMLPKAGSTAFDTFIKALQVNPHTSHVSAHLLTQEQRVRQRQLEGNSYPLQCVTVNF